jgi:hypothetical protein
MQSGPETQVIFVPWVMLHDGRNRRQTVATNRNIGVVFKQDFTRLELFQAARSTDRRRARRHVAPDGACDVLLPDACLLPPLIQWGALPGTKRTARHQPCRCRDCVPQAGSVLRSPFTGCATNSSSSGNSRWNCNVPWTAKPLPRDPLKTKTTAPFASVRSRTRVQRAVYFPSVCTCLLCRTATHLRTIRRR